MKRTATTGTMTTVDPVRFTSVPRETQLTQNGKAVMGIAITFAVSALAVAIVLTIVRARQQEMRDFIARDGVTTDATVARVTTTKGDDPRTDVTYRYAAPGGVFEGVAGLSTRAGRRIVEGDRVAVVYLRSQPARSWLAGRGPGVLPIWLIPLIAAALLAVAGALAARLQRDRVLLSEGRFADARILASTKSQHGHRVRYEFITLSGQAVTATVERGRNPGPVGTTVPVIYHRDNPRRNAFYPLSLAMPLRR
jgi:Protein of unknown function (DUF3592)